MKPKHMSVVAFLTMATSLFFVRELAVESCLQRECVYRALMHATMTMLMTCIFGFISAHFLLKKIRQFVHDKLFKVIINEKEEECSICHSIINIKDHVYDICHKFHVKCFDEWCDRNPSCPYCYKHFIFTISISFWPK